MTDNLPTDRLDPQSKGLLTRAILGAGYSIAEAQRLSSLPVAVIRNEILVKSSDLGDSLTRPECDMCLRDLALIVPAANLSEAAVARKLDLYFGLLRDAGMTWTLMVSASKQFVMRPMKGKTRWFPDPGELVEIVKEDIVDRRQRISALQRGMDIVSGFIAPPKPEPEYVQAGKMRSVAEILASRAKPEPPSVPINTQRPDTDAAELREYIESRSQR